MKKILLLTIILFITGTATAQRGMKNYLIPSFYYSAGDYENGDLSTSYSGYLLTTIDALNHIIFGYDNLTIKQPASDYNQQFFVVGEHINFFPWLISGNIGYMEGGINGRGQSFPDTEFMNVFNLNVNRNIGMFYIGASYTHSNVRGTNTLKINQAGLNLDYYPSTNFSFHIESYYSLLSDDRELISGTLTLSFKPITSWLLSVYGTIGEKAYFFDPYKLTLYSQPDIVKRVYGAKTVISFIKEINLVFDFQNMNFGDYSIKYYTGGIKFHIPM